VQISRNSIETATGPSDWFTGTVYIDPVATPSEPSRLAASSVHFTPGARTAWHTHPFGQTIYVTEGVALCQRRGGAVDEIRPGDRVFFEPGEEHWHGAAPSRFMTHLAMQEVDEEGNARELGRARERRGVRGGPGGIAVRRAATMEHRQLGRTGVPSSAPPGVAATTRRHSNHPPAVGAGINSIEPPTSTRPASRRDRGHAASGRQARRRRARHDALHADGRRPEPPRRLAPLDHRAGRELATAFAAISGTSA